jgi:hypothetical protein
MTELGHVIRLRMAELARRTCSQGQSPVQQNCPSVQITKHFSFLNNVSVTANVEMRRRVRAVLAARHTERTGIELAAVEEVMKAVLALIVIYVGTFLVAIQGASNSPVEASEQNSAAIDPVKEKEIRSLLELVGARDAIQDAANAATEQYRQKMLETSVNSDRADKFAKAYQAEFQKKFDADAVTTQLVGIYDKHFTEDEIKDLLEFYGSPTGQKVAAEMPKITREVQLTVRTASGQAARQAWQDLRAENPNLGENSRPFAARRRNPNGQGQAADAQQAQASSQQP